ncbi:hypothetical protein L596_023982 [Steinernema carpocapsae]|uniref:Uncharacterized protein n=1 Tax=Steinernema carpocapsae TaxID=34508 RepID=A0A4U5MFC8_STECR|nr:hypothetical protein L596_023982 [Steinernema carpocapsae]
MVRPDKSSCKTHKQTSKSRTAIKKKAKPMNQVLDQFSRLSLRMDDSVEVDEAPSGPKTEETTAEEKKLLAAQLKALPQSKKIRAFNIICGHEGLKRLVAKLKDSTVEAIEKYLNSRPSSSTTDKTQKKTVAKGPKTGKKVADKT